LLRQVSWLAGLYPSPPSQILQRKTQWHVGDGLTADSCGGSSGFEMRQNAPQIAPDSLLTPINAIGAPEHAH
jgi:hypothetical protein